MDIITVPTLDLARSALVIPAMAMLAVAAILTVVFGLSDILNNPDGHPKTRRMTGRCDNRSRSRSRSHSRGN